MFIYTRWERLLKWCIRRKTECDVEQCKKCKWVSISEAKWANEELNEGKVNE